MTVAFRPAESRDRTFIVDAWVSSLRMAPEAGLITMADWHSVMWQQVTRILDRPTTTTLVAYEPGETDRRVDLQGFIAADVSPGPPLVLYCFVKENYRRAGYARGLFKAIGVDPSKPFLYACKTAIVRELVRLRKIPSARFDQIAARFDSKTPPLRNNERRQEPVIEEARPRTRRIVGT